MVNHFLDNFFKQVQSSPSNIALQIKGDTYTYAHMYERAWHISEKFKHNGMSEGDRVGIMLEPSVELYCSILAALMSGIAYIPLPLSYPAARLKTIIDIGQPHGIICQDGFISEELDPKGSIIGINCDCEDETKIEVNKIGANKIYSSEVAYIMFTSGSTGTPKGVMVSHKNISSFINWATEYFAITDQDRISGHSEFSFDLSIFDMFCAWTTGACLFPVIENVDRQIPSHFIFNNKITIWFSVPAILSNLIQVNLLKSEFLSSLRWMVFCGEALPTVAAQKLMQSIPNLKVANLYGPTEATVACSAYQLNNQLNLNQSGISIGWKTGNTGIFLWSEDREVSENDKLGEIYIYGDQVSLGYWQNDLETQKNFVIDPRNNGTNRICFKTGDLAVYNDDGPIFKGRIDSQVKFRGWRIELGDIEDHLSRIEDVAECAVILIKREEKGDALAAFIRSTTKISPNKIIALLKEKLPDYMMPTHIRFIEDFPRTANGKINRKLLINLL